MRQMTIGQVARAAGIGPDTVRYYERRGLLPAAARSTSGYRQYSAEMVPQLRLIRHAKLLGFSLREIGELLELRITSTRSCAEVRRRADRKIGEIEQRIAALMRMKQELARVSAGCLAKDRRAGCSLLDALEAEEFVQ